MFHEKHARLHFEFKKWQREKKYLTAKKNVNDGGAVQSKAK